MNDDHDPWAKDPALIAIACILLALLIVGVAGVVNLINQPSTERDDG
jgi:hypothetical protein